MKQNEKITMDFCLHGYKYIEILYLIYLHMFLKENFFVCRN